jgi:coenzyme PQQ precursor peptide PqqA
VNTETLVALSRHLQEAQADTVAVHSWRRKAMAWKKPVIKNIACGMEINMYGPSEDEPRPDHPF